MASTKFPFWYFGILLNLNTVSESDCANWVEATYRAGANYCVLELAEATPDELIEKFASKCRKYGMHVGFLSRCLKAERIEHLLSAFGRIDYLMLEEAIPEKLRDLIYTLAPNIYLRGPKALNPSVTSANDLPREASPKYFDRGVYSEEDGRECWYEYDYPMLDTKPWHEDEMVVRSAEMIGGVYEGVIANGMNFLLWVSVLRTREHYSAQLKSLRDLGLRIAPKRRKRRMTIRIGVSIAVALILLFCLVRTLYVNEVYGKNQKKLAGFRSRVVSEAVGAYRYSASAPDFPGFRVNSGGLNYFLNGPLLKIDGRSVDISVTVHTYLWREFEYEVGILEMTALGEGEEKVWDSRYYSVSLDNELNPVPSTDYASWNVFERYYEYVMEQIKTGNEFFGIE